MGVGLGQVGAVEVPVAVAKKTARDQIIPVSAGMSVSSVPEGPCWPTRSVGGAGPRAER